MNNPVAPEGPPKPTRTDELVNMAVAGLYLAGACASGSFTALGLNGLLRPELTTGILRDLSPLFLCVGALGDLAVTLPVVVLVLRKLRII